MKCEFAILLISVVSAVSVASGRTWYVNADGSGDAPTIQAGIDSAAVGDTVMLASGTYTSDGNRDLNFKGKPVVVRSESGDPTLCTIDCEGDWDEYHRGVVFSNGEDSESRLEGVTLTGGFGEKGLGILCENASCPAISDCVITDNHGHGGGGSVGGGIACNGGSCPLITDCIVSYNSASFFGGGMNVHDSSPVLISVTFEGNAAGEVGGAVYCDEGSPQFTDCRFVGNSVTMYEGGAFSGYDCSPVFSDCVFKENESYYGGAIFAMPGPAGSTMLLDGCLLISNRAYSIGGAIMFDGFGGDLAVTIAGCTFSHNQVQAHNDYGGGMFVTGAVDVAVETSIIAFSTSGQAIDCDHGATATLHCCDLYGNAGGDWTAGLSTQLGVNGNMSENPLFCDVAGGSFTLEDCSPCLPGYHPQGYDCAGPIGAQGPGCACGTPTQAATWGAIKSMYR
jgi:predicted outer membrane repeat protein